MTNATTCLSLLPKLCLLQKATQAVESKPSGAGPSSEAKINTKSDNITRKRKMQNQRQKRYRERKRHKGLGMQAHAAALVSDITSMKAELSETSSTVNCINVAAATEVSHSRAETVRQAAKFCFPWTETDKNGLPEFPAAGRQVNHISEDSVFANDAKILMMNQVASPRSFAAQRELLHGSRWSLKTGSVTCLDEVHQSVWGMTLEISTLWNDVMKNTSNEAFHRRMHGVHGRYKMSLGFTFDPVGSTDNKSDDDNNQKVTSVIINSMIRVSPMARAFDVLPVFAQELSKESEN